MPPCVKRSWRDEREALEPRGAPAVEPRWRECESWGERARVRESVCVRERGGGGGREGGRDVYYRCRANMAHLRQSSPDYGLAFQLKVLETFQAVPSSLGSGKMLQLSAHGLQMSAHTGFSCALSRYAMNARCRLSSCTVTPFVSHRRNSE